MIGRFKPRDDARGGRVRSDERKGARGFALEVAGRTTEAVDELNDGGGQRFAIRLGDRARIAFPGRARFSREIEPALQKAKTVENEVGVVAFQERQEECGVERLAVKDARQVFGAARAQFAVALELKARVFRGSPRSGIGNNAVRILPIGFDGSPRHIVANGGLVGWLAARDALKSAQSGQKVRGDRGARNLRVWIGA